MRVDEPGHSAACSVSGPLPDPYELYGRSGRASVPAPLPQRLRVPGSRAALTGRAAFRDELGTHARGAVLQERIAG